MQSLRKTLLVAGMLLLTACSAEAPAMTTGATHTPALVPPTTMAADPRSTTAPTSLPAEEVAAPTPADQATDPDAPLPPNARLSGPTIDFDNLRLTLPPALAEQATAARIGRAPSGADAPYWAVYPEHPQLTLDGYALQGTVLQPRITVYPVAEYEAMNEVAAREIAALRALLEGGPRAQEQPLPVLPPLNATQVLRARVEELRFEGGRGLRYLAQHDQNVAPINNQSLFYTFQGITDDGAHYVSAIFPVAAPFLPEGYGPEPEGGVPFPNPNVDGALQQLPAYFEAVGQRLEQLPAQEFTPDLALLDQLVTSIAVR